MEKKLAILMADLSGYSALTEIHGAAKAAYVIHKYQDTINYSLVGESFLLETVGDQVVIISANSDDLVNTALLLQINTMKISHFLSIHVGIHYGSVLEIDGHYYGSAVNLTARITAKASKGKILASKEFLNTLSTPHLFEPFGLVRFKNILEAVEVVELMPASPYISKHHDPVCQMQLDEIDLFRSITLENETFYFCSEGCQHVFSQNQTQFVRA